MKQRCEASLYQLRSIFPPLGHDSVKGSNGIIGIIGGSYEYTGAPYYAAISSIKMGADMAHIFCSKSAAIPIKSYSPELIVHPVFAGQQELSQDLTQTDISSLQDEWVAYLSKYYSKINSWVIGPGLGRDKIMVSFFPKLVSSFPKETLVTLDADALYMLCQHPDILPTLRSLKCILTPNHRQFKHLNQILKIPETFEDQRIQDQGTQGICQVSECQNGLNLTLVRKGKADAILTASGKKMLINAEGSRKRCGGIGDVLAGCIATCSYWDHELGPALACYVAKQASRAAFEQMGRSLTAIQVIEAICGVVKGLERQ